MENYFDLTFGTNTEHLQQERGSFEHYAHARDVAPPPTLDDDLLGFLRDRDSFYLASIGEGGWPYVQHRGGPTGFIKIAGPTRIAWGERSGNRQFLTAGNLGGDDRVAIIAVDYPSRSRVKLLGHARFDAAPDPIVLDQLGIDGRLEGLVTVDIVAFDWNCPKYITPRFTAEQIDAAVEPLRRRISELEAELAALGQAS